MGSPAWPWLPQPMTTVVLVLPPGLPLEDLELHPNALVAMDTALEREKLSLSMDTLELPLWRTETMSMDMSVLLDILSTNLTLDFLLHSRLVPSFTLDLARGRLSLSMDTLELLLLCRTTTMSMDMSLALDMLSTNLTLVLLDLTRMSPGFTLDLARGRLSLSMVLLSILLVLLSLPGLPKV